MLHFVSVLDCLLFERHADFASNARKHFRSTTGRRLHLGLFAAVAVSEELRRRRAGGVPGVQPEWGSDTQKHQETRKASQT